MHIGRKNSKAKYSLLGKIISVTKEDKDLGVYFSENFKPHINCKKVCKTANKITGLIRRNISNKTREGMMILYKTLVRPVLE